MSHIRRPRNKNKKSIPDSSPWLDNSIILKALWNLYIHSNNSHSPTVIKVKIVKNTPGAGGCLCYDWCPYNSITNLTPFENEGLNCSITVFMMWLTHNPQMKDAFDTINEDNQSLQVTNKPDGFLAIRDIEIKQTSRIVDEYDRKTIDYTITF